MAKIQNRIGSEQNNVIGEKVAREEEQEVIYLLTESWAREGENRNSDGETGRKTSIQKVWEEGEIEMIRY